MSDHLVGTTKLFKKDPNAPGWFYNVEDPTERSQFLPYEPPTGFARWWEGCKERIYSFFSFS